MTTFEDKYGILVLAAGNKFKKNYFDLEGEEFLYKKKQKFNKIKMQRKSKHAWKYEQY